MDELSMIFALVNFSIFIFAAICVFAYNNRKRQDFKIIIYASGIYTIGLFFFYYDVKNLLLGKTSFILTFTTCVLVFLALILFVKSLTKLYHIESKINFVYSITYVIVISFGVGFFSYHGWFFYRAALYYVGVIVPLIFALVYQYQSKETSMFNLISAQIFVMFIVVIANTVSYLLYDEVLDFTNPPIFTKIYLLMANTLVITMIFSFIIERNGQDIIELREKGTLLENMFNRVKLISETDELTHAYNRRKIKDIIEMLMVKYKTTKTPYSIMLVDIDDFKRINDTYSHQIGDEVLKYVTEVLDSTTRDADYLGRWGGDEFVLVLSNTSFEKCEFVKRKIQSMEKTFIKDDLRIPIGLSIGCSESLSDLSFDEVIHNADMCLYNDKKIRKNELEKK